MNPDIAQAAPSLISEKLVTIAADGSASLEGGRCRACSALSFPRAQVCTECLSTEIEGVTLSSEGRLYSFSVVHQAPKGWKVPYALGYVDLPEGIRVLGHIDAPPDTIVIDQLVKLSLGVVATDASGADQSTYTFVPA
ncbi:hypothetical protein ATER59S_05706 [Aquamicrobium terrae]